MKKILLFFLLIAFGGVLNTQEYVVRNWSVEDGLAQSEVMSVSQTDDGYIWIATRSGGISRFDGKTFKTYDKNKGLPSASVYHTIVDKKGTLWAITETSLIYLKGNKFVTAVKSNELSVVYKLFADNDNNIWLCDINKGFFKFDGKELKKLIVPDSIDFKQALDITQTKDGDYWLATFSGLYQYDGKTFKRFSKKDGLTDDYIYSIFVDKDQNIWFGNYLSITKYDGKSFKIFKSKDVFGTANFDVRNLTQDSFGNIWASTTAGLFKYDGRNFTRINLSGDKSGNLSFLVSEDKEKNIWIASNGKGVYMLRPNNFSHYSKNEGLLGSGWGFAEDKYGDIWIATENGLTKISPNSNKTYTKKDGLPSDIVYAINYDKKNNLWLGTTEGLVEFKNGKFINHKFNKKERDRSVITITADKKDNLWLGTFNGLYKYTHDKQTYFPLSDSVNVIVVDIYEDNEGKIWIGTEYNGLKYFDGKKFVDFHINEKIDLRKVWNVTQDHKGNFWFGHGDNGLIFYNPKTKDVKTINSKDNLIDNSIISLQIDKNGYLWGGTNRGVSRLDLNSFYNKNKIVIRNYKKYDGFTSIECNQNAIFADSKNNIWFGTIKGASKYNSNIKNEIFEEFQKGNKELFTPKVKINEIIPFNSDLDLNDFSDGIDSLTLLPVNLKLPYSDNKFTINFSGIYFTNPDEVYFSYKLEGFDENWSPVTKISSATYTNLSPGKYTFLLKAKSDANIWTEIPVSYTFSIETPIYRTWWFYLLLVILTPTIIYVFIKFRLFKLTKQKEHLESLVNFRTEQLQKENEKVESINKELELINSELSETNLKLEKSNSELEKLSIVARETDNAIYITDPEGNLEWVNAGAERMTGYTYEEFIIEKGKNIFEFSGNSDIKKIFDECVIYKKSKKYEAVNSSKSGRKYYGASTVTPIFDDEGNVKKFIIIETDITYRKLIEQELQSAHDDLEKRVKERTAELQETNDKLKHEISIREWTEKELIVARDKAEAADKLKSAFLAQMSHEIRTPLNVILSYTNLLSDELEGKLDETLNSIFAGINNAGTRLIRTIDLILNMSSIQTGNFEVNIKELNLQKIIEKMLIEFRSLNKNDRIKLNFENKVSNTNVLADDYSTQQIFQNIIDNAIKYTPEGNINISIYSDEQKSTCVEIADEGIGISEEYLSKLFEPFSQEQIGYTRKYEGNGLGLALVKKYVEMNNAEIFVESEKGTGTKFTVKFKGD